MSETFDPYHKWLGIPPEEQPPNCYRLLGLPLFEDQAEVIDNAADQRMVHLRSFQAGQHSKLSQKLLNEVSAARVMLLDAAKKAAYDEQLRQRTAAKDENSFEALLGPIDEAARPSARRRSKRSAAPILLSLLGVEIGRAHV